jgi:hypothetical protein
VKSESRNSKERQWVEKRQNKRMEAVDMQSARLQGELSTVIQSAAGNSMDPSPGRTSIG